MLDFLSVAECRAGRQGFSRLARFPPDGVLTRLPVPSSLCAVTLLTARHSALSTQPLDARQGLFEIGKDVVDRLDAD
jgi:hypothetical protein